MPVRARQRTDGPEQVRKRRADGERRHKHADRDAAPLTEPTRKDLDRHRVHPGQCNAGEDPKWDRTGCVMSDVGEAEVRSPSAQRSDGQQVARGNDIGGADRRKAERARREPELDGDREIWQVKAAKVPFGAQQWRNGRGAKPWCEAEQLRRRENRQNPPPVRRLAGARIASHRRGSINQ